MPTGAPVGDSHVTVTVGGIAFGAKREISGTPEADDCHVTVTGLAVS